MRSGLFEAHSYQVSKQTGLIDYDAIEQQVLELRPLILFTQTTALRLNDAPKLA